MPSLITRIVFQRSYISGREHSEEPAIKSSIYIKQAGGAIQCPALLSTPPPPAAELAPLRGEAVRLTSSQNVKVPASYGRFAGEV